MTSLPEFFGMCAQADWTHEYSDDASVRKRGYAEADRLRSIAKESDAHKRMFDAWQGYAWSQHNAVRPKLEDFT